MNNAPEPFGKYVLMERIAIGGMAEIFRAKMLNGGGEDLCIKRILPHYSEDESFVNMFIDEASIAAKLQHENIVQIFDFDTVEGCYYIAMELIDGRDLKQTLEMCSERKTMIPVETVMVIIQGLSRSLQYAHTKEVNGEPLNIVHRDVSPHNVMMSFSGDVKLTDFGIAKAASRLTTTRAGTVKGKCAYMSPEQARGKTLDGRSDIFSIGILMYEMLTGQRLFTGDSDFDILTKVLKEPITPPSQFHPGLDPEVERMCLKALERDRDLRYGSCAAMDRDATDWVAQNLGGDASRGGLGPFLQALFGLTAEPLPQPGKGMGVAAEIAEIADMKTAMFNRDDFMAPEDSPAPGGQTADLGDAIAQFNTVKADPLRPSDLVDSPAPTTEMQPRMIIPSPMGSSSPAGSEEKTQAMDISQFTGASAVPDRRPTPSRGMSRPQGISPMGAPIPPWPDDEKKGIGVVPIVIGVGVLGFLMILLVAGVGAAFYLFNASDSSPDIDGRVIEADVETGPATSGSGPEADGDDKGDDKGEDPEVGGGEGDDKVENTEVSTANLTIHSEPQGASIEINGKKVDDATPTTIEEMALSEAITVKLTLEGYEAAEQEVVLSKDQRLDFALVKVKGDDKVEEVAGSKGDPKELTPEEREERRKKREEARKKREAQKGTGTLSINAVPYADVTVDGRRIGRTPKNIKVSAGKAHSVILTSPNKKKKVFRVKVPKDGKKAVFHIFK